MNGRDLPGYKKKSFLLPFAGGEIWGEHLDGLYEYTELAIEKFENDYLKFKRPSMTSLLIINLDETVITEALINVITEKLMLKTKRYMKIAFVGVDKKSKKIFLKKLMGAEFAIAFTDDFEKVKEWVVSEEY